MVSSGIKSAVRSGWLCNHWFTKSVIRSRFVEDIGISLKRYYVVISYGYHGYALQDRLNLMEDILTQSFWNLKQLFALMANSISAKFHPQIYGQQDSILVAVFSCNVSKNFVFQPASHLQSNMREPLFGPRKGGTGTFVKITGTRRSSSNNQNSTTGETFKTCKDYYAR